MSRSGFARAALGALALLLLLAHAAGHLRLPGLDALDAAAFDARTRAFPAPAPDRRLAVVHVDEAALAAHGRWPWPRETLAALVQALGDGGALLVGLDLILAEPGSAAGDAALAAALRRQPTVLGLHLNAAAGTPRTGMLPPGLPLPADVPAALHAPWPGHAGPLPALLQAAAGAGFVNAHVDGDGVTRRAPLYTVHEGRLQPGLALAMARVLAGDAALGLRRFANPEGLVLLPWPAEAGQVRRLSAADVLAGRAAPGAGSVVLVGTSAAGLGDRHTPPAGAPRPGVDLHAQLLGGLLAGRLPQVPAWAPAAGALALLGPGLLLFFALPRLSPWAGASLAGGCAAALVALNLGAWAGAGLALPLAAPLAGVVLLYALQLFYGQLAEAWKRRRLAALFGQYVPPELVAQMSRDPERYSMEGRAAELTVLFADVRGFTTFSEQLAPTELAALMNRYLSVMTGIVRTHRGTLDKYIGDALMAFWGAPVDDPAHAEHAVRAALAMQAALPALNEEFAARGWPPIRITIGVNTGPMVVGDMGSVHRRAYTVLGDAVNVAARLQELSGKLEVPVLLGEATAAALPPSMPCRPVERVTLRGRATPMQLFDARGP